MGSLDSSFGSLDGDDEIDVDSVDTEQSVTITDDETVSYGRDHGNTVDGQNVVVGVGARALADVNKTVSGDDPRAVHLGYEAGRNSDQFGTVASGYQAAKSNTGNNVTASGYQAARDNTGNEVTASGYKAAQNNTGGRVTASGYRVAEKNTGNNATASGYRAARNNTGDRVTASGYQAAQNNTGNNVTASGYLAARDNTGSNVTASGPQAARNNTGDNVTASGFRAARGDGLADPSTMGDDNIGIGASAIRNNQASGLIAIGQEAGINAQTDDQLIITDRNGNRRMVMDLTNGNLKIEGSLTENASL